MPHQPVRVIQVSALRTLRSEEARLMIIDGINYAAYKETDSSLHDSDKNRLFGSEHYNSGREVVKPSPWAEGDFEEKMAMLLRWANALNRSDPAFAQALSLLEGEDSLIGLRHSAHQDLCGSMSVIDSMTMSAPSPE